MRRSEIDYSEEDLELRAAGYAILMALAAVVFVVAAAVIGVVLA
ncbi:hypothetical protein [Roseicyclus marinus]|nr:hypothetical protein [Roseicyclus marinus]MDG3041814.1 hypothetical protein [Roseicyclus marinus]